jgi:acetylornithine deacetylase/succinyl-diaminopimelate desuccinylase-like protein
MATTSQPSGPFREHDRFLDDHFATFVAELGEWLAIPSISSLPEHRGDVRRAAEWLRARMEACGFPEATLIETAGHPLVYGEWPATADDAPTLLLYGHYDVQPTDPIEEWHRPPFTATIDGDHLYGRGASDDKAQVVLLLAALQAWARLAGGPPVHIKMLVEGEEEAGGAGIAAFVQNNPARLAADTTLICDTAMLRPDRPSLVTGLRGILYTEIEVSGAQRDLHSGAYGGVAPNPLHALCLLLSRLKGEDGVIQIPKLAAAIPVASEAEKRFWQEDPFDIAGDLRREMGLGELVGEAGYPPLERLGLRPTLELHGISGGFTGAGSKTVIPARATAKVSLRLPAGLDPGVVFGWLEEAVHAKLPAGHRARVTKLHGGRGLYADPDSPAVRAAAEALTAVYGTAPVFVREGGSIPIAALFAEVLQTPVVLMGFALPDDSIHAPNERFSLRQFRLGMKTVANYLGRLGGLG